MAQSEAAPPRPRWSARASTGCTTRCATWHQHGVSWQSQLKQQVEDVRHSTDVLRRETATLSTALRKPAGPRPVG